jgi:hypothetical protein
VKKLISIGVALALLAMVVVPSAVAAEITPTTYAKLPFAIIGSGFYLLESILNSLVAGDVLPASLDWLPDLMPTLGDWAAGPLSWSVDMLAWGVALLGNVMGAAQTALEGMGISLGTMDLSALKGLCDTISCGLFQVWNPAIGSNFTSPCAGLP